MGGLNLRGRGVYLRFLVGKKGILNMLYGDHVGGIFPSSLLRTGKYSSLQKILVAVRLCPEQGLYA